MTTVRFGKNFLKSAQTLPTAQQKKLAKLLVLMRDNPFHPLLHAKRLSGSLVGFLSFRINREWRAIFQFLEPSVIQLLRVAHRKDIYR